MNRKVTFTKNPRHLNSSIAYSVALNNAELGSSGQHKTLLEQQRTLSSTNTCFVANPSYLVFSEYETNHTYEAEIQLINHSKHTQRIKLTPLNKK